MKASVSGNGKGVLHDEALRGKGLLFMLSSKEGVPVSPLRIYSPMVEGVYCWGGKRF